MSDFPAAYAALADIQRAYAPHLVVVHDDERGLYLDTHHLMPNGKPLFFGEVRTGKRYVSYHLMPVYVEPALLDESPPALRKRMQGKSCFNFKDVDAGLFEALAALTQRGFDLYVARGYVTV